MCEKNANNVNNLGEFWCLKSLKHSEIFDFEIKSPRQHGFYMLRSRTTGSAGVSVASAGASWLEE